MQNNLPLFIRKNLFKVVVLFCGLINQESRAQSSYFPPLIGKTWTSTAPSNFGWCQDRIDSLYQYLGNHNSKAFILLIDGKIVLEKYFGTFTQDSIWYWASAGKTLTGFCLGIAQQEGSLKITEPSNKYLGKGWTSLSQTQEDSITIRHHLSMTTGLDDGVSDPNCTDPNCLKYKADAGKRWAYHNAPYTLLDKVIESATGNTLNQFVYQKITKITGIQGLFYKSGYLNVFASTPRSFARFGLLLLNKGNWNGNKIILDTQYYYDQTNSSQSINPSYGYLTWLNGKSSYMLPQVQFQFSGSICDDAPSDMFAALGKNGQIINVVPSKNMVWIRMGNAPDASPAGAISVSLNNDIWKYLNQMSCSSMIEKTQPDIVPIQFSPNPIHANDGIEISSILQSINHQEAIKIKAIDLSTGRSISCPINGTIINTQSLQSGVYYFQIEDKNTVITKQKVIVLP